MTGPFAQRPCPSCADRAAVVEMASTPAAETKTLDELRPYWRGLFKEKVFFTYNRCKNCDLLYAPAFFSSTELADLYSAMPPNMELVPQDALEATQRGYWTAVRSGAPLEGDYLEIGPDIGFLVERAAAEGAFGHFWLVEPNRSVHAQLAAAAGDKSHTIISDMDDLSPVPDNAVGLAVMVHVLDHLLDPLAALIELRAKLKPGGRLVIVTHNEASLLRSLMRGRWPPFCLQHPQLFKPRSITALLTNAGYRTLSVTRSKNYFPIGFMVRQAAYSVGLDLTKLPLPRAAIGLKLGNIITIAEK